MAHNTDYSRIWDPSGNTEGLSLYEIAKSLGVSTQNLGRLCTSPSINIWAKYKPVDLERFAPVTLAERKEINYGFNDLFSNDPSFVLAKAKRDGGKWDYVVPKIGDGKFRQLDFSEVNTGAGTIGYDRNAIPTVELLSMPSKPTRDGYYVCSAKLNNADIRFDEFKQTEQSGLIWTLAVLCKHSTEETAPEIILGDSLFVSGSMVLTALQTGKTFTSDENKKTFDLCLCLAGVTMSGDVDPKPVPVFLAPVPDSYRLVKWDRMNYGLIVSSQAQIDWGEKFYEFEYDAWNNLTSASWAFEVTNHDDDFAHDINFYMEIIHSFDDGGTTKYERYGADFPTTEHIGTSAVVSNIIHTLDLGKTGVTWEKDRTYIRIWYTYRTTNASSALVTRYVDPINGDSYEDEVPMRSLTEIETGNTGS